MFSHHTGPVICKDYDAKVIVDYDNTDDVTILAPPGFEDALFGSYASFTMKCSKEIIIIPNFQEEFALDQVRFLVEGAVQATILILTESQDYEYSVSYC